MKSLSLIKQESFNKTKQEILECFENPLEQALALFLNKAYQQEGEDKIKNFSLDELVSFVEEDTLFILDLKVDWSNLETLIILAKESRRYEKYFVLNKVAENYAKIKHDSIGHKRKYTGEPYWVHLQEVSSLVAQVGGTYFMQSAAFLHDTVEDVKVSLEEIEEVFGKEICILVEMLTDVSKPEDGNRAKRKALDLEHTKNSSKEAKTIKLADLISNSLSITFYDPNFAKVYMKEKKALLEVLKEGHPQLYQQAKEILDNYYSKT